ncbi:hypothetical protein ACFL3G_12320 [Planctomycetota bacterium]
MKLKQVFSRYRKPVCFILTVFVCISLLVGFRFYKNAHRKPIEVYDLTWPDKTDANRPVFRKWRYFIETKTNLPRKVEKYYKLAPEDNYILEETLVVSYPTTEEIKSVIKDAGF